MVCAGEEAVQRLDPKLVHEAISGSGSSSAMFEVRGALMAEGEYNREGMNFSIPLKDSRLIAEHAARHLVPTPIYHAALQNYYAAVAQGHGAEDQSAVCAAMERAANCERAKKPGSGWLRINGCMVGSAGAFSVVSSRLVNSSVLGRRQPFRPAIDRL